MVEQLQERFHIEKLVLAALVTLYGFFCMTSPGTWRLLDGVNFLFHEAGHFFFMPFGQFLHFLGGTLGQLFFPVVCTAYFFYKKQPFSAFVVLFWVGQNMFNISVYAGDAVATQLPILEGGTHDWNWMLSRLSMLRYTKVLSWLIYLSGCVCYLASVIGMFRSSVREEEQEFFG